MEISKARGPWIRTLIGTLTSLGLCTPLACSSSSNSSDTHASSDNTSGSGGSGGTSSGGSDNSSSSGQTNGSGGATESTAQGNTGTGGTAQADGGSAGEVGSSASGAAGAGGSCSVDVAEHPLSAGIHVTECSAIEYTTNPPSSGEHYSVWAAYQSYDFPLPRGYWVHALEHGAVVITYNCDDGCPDEVDQVRSLIDDLPADPRCSAAGLDHQIILTPDPLLDTRWAMSSWGYTLRADCVAEGSFEQFYLDHFGHGPEDLCGGGTAFTEAALTPGCGEP